MCFSDALCLSDEIEDYLCNMQTLRRINSYKFNTTHADIHNTTQISRFCFRMPCLSASLCKLPSLLTCFPFSCHTQCKIPFPEHNRHIRKWFDKIPAVASRHHFWQHQEHGIYRSILRLTVQVSISAQVDTKHVSHLLTKSQRNINCIVYRFKLTFKS